MQTVRSIEVKKSILKWAITTQEVVWKGAHRIDEQVHLTGIGKADSRGQLLERIGRFLKLRCWNNAVLVRILVDTLAKPSGRIASFGQLYHASHSNHCSNVWKNFSGFCMNGACPSSGYSTNVQFGPIALAVSFPSRL